MFGQPGDDTASTSSTHFDSLVTERAAIVTGASRGIGYALAETLAQEGFALRRLPLAGKSLDEAADRLRQHGRSVEVVAGDIAAGKGAAALAVGLRRPPRPQSSATRSR